MQVDCSVSVFLLSQQGPAFIYDPLLGAGTKLLYLRLILPLNRHKNRLLRYSKQIYYYRFGVFSLSGRTCVKLMVDTEDCNRVQ